MMVNAVAWADAGDVSEIVLTTNEQNLPAMGLFRKFGFVKRGREEELERKGLGTQTGKGFYYLMTVQPKSVCHG